VLRLVFDTAALRPQFETRPGQTSKQENKTAVPVIPIPPGE